MPDIAHLSKEFNDLLKIMSSFNPDKRPTVADLILYPVLVPVHLKTRKQLFNELQIEKMKNAMLAQ